MTTRVKNAQAPAETNTGQLENHLTQRACSLCISTAHRLIETIHANLDTLYRSSGWHSIYCEYLNSPEHRLASYNANVV
jgi:hypothetical protein